MDVNTFPPMDLSALLKHFFEKLRDHNGKLYNNFLKTLQSFYTSSQKYYSKLKVLIIDIML